MCQASRGAWDKVDGETANKHTSVSMRPGTEADKVSQNQTAKGLNCHAKNTLHFSLQALTQFKPRRARLETDSSGRWEAGPGRGGECTDRRQEG